MTRKELVTADFANIEGCVCAWLAGQDDLVEFFANDGPLYERMGGVIFGLSTEQVIAKGKVCIEREIGKRAILGCQFGIGALKFQGTVKKEANLKIPLAMAEKAVKAWRQLNNHIVAFWADLDEAATTAVRKDGAVVTCGKIKYRKNGSFLRCQLPSGRCLTYPYPRLAQMVWVEHIDPKTGEPNGVKSTMQLAHAHKAAAAGKVDLSGKPFWSLVYKGVNSRTKKWGEINAYGGLLVENVTQAAARDLMAEAMLRVEAAGYPVVLTVHDEIVSEVSPGFGSLSEFERLMAVVPAWAAGCPVSAKGWRGERYRK